MSEIWSKELPFEREYLDSVPDKPGVYQILQSIEYPRYQGKTRILKIGASKSNLRTEIENHFIRHTAANRLHRVRNQQDLKVTLIYLLTNENKSIEIEKRLLKQFEDSHWDLPLLNSTRGYARGEDNHYREKAT
jgi:hypothetical protein